ncbi:MAG: site-2 protease family protein [Clostridiales bacterium]|nr:site-2 protease family protein [Clostridiales bacterium]
MYLGFILLSIIVLLVMVLIHELGHYTAAKILGFTVEEFSVGFGPKLISRVRRNGERWSLRLLPLGGYCAFYGDEASDADEQKPQNDAVLPKTAPQEEPMQQEGKDSVKDSDDLLSYVMRSKLEEDKATAVAQNPAPVRLDKNGNVAKTFFEHKPWKRIIVLLGGVAFNFLSAIIFALIYIWAVGCPAPQIADVYTDAQGNPYNALQKGDIVLAVDGHDITVMTNYNELVQNAKEGDTVKFKIDRNGQIMTVDVQRKKIVTTDEDGKVTEYVGFGFVSQTEFINANAAHAFTYCVPYTFKLSWSILGSFGQLITGQVPITQVTGPVGSVKLMADVTRADWRNILILLPLLASNLAMFNLLPFPALDGAQIVFTIIEWIRKKPIKRKIQGIINAVGLVTLLLFVLIVDILSFAL